MANLVNNVELTVFDPHLDQGEPPLQKPAVYFIGTNHDLFLDYRFPKGSVVIDPWRIIKKQEGVHLISIGRSAQARVAENNPAKYEDISSLTPRTEGILPSRPGSELMVHFSLAGIRERVPASIQTQGQDMETNIANIIRSMENPP